MSRALRGLALAGALAGLAAAPCAAAEFAVFYLAPNAGSASGGHVALRIGERVYHYQNAAGGTLELTRDPFDFFRYAYTVLENRSLEAWRVGVRDEALERLRMRFEARYRVQRQHLALRDALRRSRELLERAAAEDEAPLALDGVGFFAEGEGVGGEALRALRERIRVQRGDDFLPRRIAALEHALREAAPTEEPLPELDRDALPALPYTFWERWSDLVLEQRALRAIENGHGLEAHWLRAEPGATTPPLSGAERAALAGYLARLEAAIPERLDSPRRDRGRVLLLALARSVALRESLEAGRLVVLDAFPAEAQAIPAAALRERSGFLAELRAETARRLAEARAALLAAPVDELGYNALEDAANRRLELERGLREDHAVRLFAGRLLPEGAGEIARPPLPRRAGAAHAAASARAREAAHARAVERVYGYRLFTRNCATELLDTVRAALDAAELGGEIDPYASLRFVPRRAFAEVGRRWNVVGQGEIPSLRRTRIEEMARHEPPWQVALRESNTFTSTVYRANPHDSFFVFFTDGNALLRPLLGAANLVAGGGALIGGVARLPFDRGRAALAGAKGVLFSLPELAGWSLRKGSLEHARSPVPRTRWRTVSGPGT